MNETLTAAVAQLESALPDSGNFAAGGFLVTTQELIAAVKARDVWRAFSAETDLQVMIRDAMRGDGGDVINFGAASFLPGLSWLQFLQLIMTIVGELLRARQVGQDDDAPHRATPGQTTVAKNRRTF